MRNRSHLIISWDLRFLSMLIWPWVVQKSQQGAFGSVCKTMLLVKVRRWKYIYVCVKNVLQASTTCLAESCIFFGNDLILWHAKLNLLSCSMVFLLLILLLIFDIDSSVWHTRSPMFFFPPKWKKETLVCLLSCRYFCFPSRAGWNLELKRKIDGEEMGKGKVTCQIC